MFLKSKFLKLSIQQMPDNRHYLLKLLDGNNELRIRRLQCQLKSVTHHNWSKKCIYMRAHETGTFNSTSLV